MKTFTDKDGSKWSIELPMGTILRVKKADAKFDLFEPWTKRDESTLQEILWDDLGEFFELLWLLVEPQATTRNINADQFGELMAAESIILARLAFFEEWQDFFRQLQRPQVATALEKTVKLQKKMLELVVKKLEDERLTTVDKTMASKMQSVLNKSFGESLDLLDKTLADIPGEN